MIFSRDDLERIKQSVEEPGRPASPQSIVNQIIPLTPATRKQPVKYTLDDPQPMAEPEAPARTEPVAAPVPVKKKKVIITDMNTGVRKIEYR
jgi:hypothetical protein